MTESQALKFLFIEPFYGGSHRDVADGWVHFSKHTIDLVTLPARFWKWRMRGAALHLSQKLSALDAYDGLITTGLMSLADLKALIPSKWPKVLLYMHENQLTYPLAPNETIDYQFGFTNIATALTADKILFNSHTHYQAFFEALPCFIKMMPDFQPRWVVDAIKAKADVLYPGCWFEAEPDSESGQDQLEPGSVPLIIWNHRWEFDKNPDDFFTALSSVLSRGHEFHLALLGEHFQTIPDVFAAAQERYGERIVHSGYIPSRSAYYEWLSKGSVVISTAIQENFGISMIEAIRRGCFPLVPNRLVYPEIIPPEFHKDCLYKSQTELVEKLCRILADPSRFTSKTQALSRSMGVFAWHHRIKAFDSVLSELVSM